MHASFFSASAVVPGLCGLVPPASCVYTTILSIRLSILLLHSLELAETRSTMPSPFYSSLPPPIPIDRMTPLGTPSANQYPARISQPSSPSYSTDYPASPGGTVGYAYEAPFYVPSQSLAPPSPSYNNFASAQALPSSSHLSTPSGHVFEAPTTTSSNLTVPDTSHEHERPRCFFQSRDGS